MRSSNSNSGTANTKPVDSAPSELHQKEGRVVAIDALRGFDMFWIAGGREVLLTFVGIFKHPIPDWLDHQFTHVKWEGFVAWDLIMPLFLFVVGAAMPFSFARQLEHGRSKTGLHVKILRRTLILFILGMAVQGHLLDFKLDTLHIFANTLQAIAVGYLIAGIVMLNVGVVGQVIFAALMLIGFWALLMFYPLAGVGAGSLEPHANVAYAVDKFVLGRFIDGTEPPYTWVLSGMTFTATVLMGVFGGHVLRSRMSPMVRVFVLTLMGVGCLAAGWVWAEMLGFTIIKHIWTSSMALWAGGWSYLLLALFYLLIDVLGFRRWAFPFVVTGANAILIYVLWDLVVPFGQIANTLTGGLAAHLGRVGPLLVAFTAVMLWWVILYDLYRRKIYLRI
jgi:predicted acyltransferase